MPVTTVPVTAMAVAGGALGDRRDLAQVQQLGEAAARARLDDVRVRMGGDEGALAADEPREHRALRRGLRDRRHAAHEQRVVHEQKVVVALDGLIDGRGHGIHREQYA